MLNPERIELKGYRDKIQNAPVVKLADTMDLGSIAARCAGSSPVRRKFPDVAESADVADSKSVAEMRESSNLSIRTTKFNERKTTAMRVYDTPNGKFLCDMDLKEKKILDDFWFYSINDIESIIDIIRSGCGDEFASDFGKLLHDFNDFTEETLTDAVCYNSENRDDDDTDYDLCELEDRLETAEKKLSQIHRLCKSASGLLSILSFGQKSKFGDILKDLKEIEKLSETL